jgi:hypothetical protein
MIAKILMLTLMLLALPSLAHEGHDKVPGAKLTPRGGQLMDLKHMHLELVVSKEGLKLYPSDHDYKPVSPKDVVVLGNVTFPRGKGSEAVKFEAQGDAFVAKVDAKGAHRYTLDVTAKYKDQEDKAQFTVEPNP